MKHWFHTLQMFHCRTGPRHKRLLDFLALGMGADLAVVLVSPLADRRHFCLGGPFSPSWFIVAHENPYRYGVDHVPALAVVCQEVVDIETGSADRWFLIQAGVRTMPVVTVGPGLEFVAALG